MFKFSKLTSLILGISIGINAFALTTVPGNVVSDFNPAKVATTIGDPQAENTAYFVIRWNDSKGMENLAFAVKFDPSEEPTPETLLEKAYSLDFRFYKDDQGALCFDLNGDNVHDGDLALYDHRALDGEEGIWTLTAPHTTVENGDLIFAEFLPKSGEKGKFATAPLFYLPDADTIGAWIQAEKSLALADAQTEVPVYINVGKGTINNLYWKYTSDPEGNTQISNILTITLSAADVRAGKTVALLTTRGQGDAYVWARPQYKPDGTGTNITADFLDSSTMSVTAPLRPLTGIAWKQLDEPLQLSHNYTLTDFLVMEPADATYTGGFTFKYIVPTGGQRICSVSGSTLYTRDIPGNAELSVTSKIDNEITATGTFEIALVHPVSDIEFVNIDPSVPLVIEFDPYKMEYNNTSALIKVIPENADISRLSIRLIDPQPEDADEDGKVTFEFGMWNGPTPMKYDLVTTYLQNDGAYDIMVWGPGTTKAVFESTDGSGTVSPEITINIVPRHMEITDEFSDGTFWLNEEWFGHSNGSINYFDKDGNVNYRVYNYANSDGENPRADRTFGCTSQYGMIFGDRLYVMSKQADDAGDSYQTGGGRLVIADAKTMKRLHSFDVIGADPSRGGDGRACVGISADKVYLGHHAGIRVLNIDNSAETPEEMFKLGKELTFNNSGDGGDLTPGNPSGALYSNQVGDMVYACGHVFAVMQDRGLLVIDTQKDEHILTLGDKNVQAVTQSSDGDIWYASNNTETGVTSLHRVNPETLEETESYDLPDTAGSINTGWGAWRSANFFASRSQNVLFWGNVGSGYQDNILGKGTGNIYRWEIGQKLPTEPFFSLGNTPGKDAETFQSPYATMRYDDRFDRILMATTHGASYNYRYNWIYFINGSTGEIERVQELTRYFWFPAIPIFPDKYAPEINLEQLKISSLGVTTDFDLSEYITDPDNITRNINLRLKGETADNPDNVEDSADLIAPETQSEESGADMECSLEGHILHVTLNKTGKYNLHLIAESNGKEVSKDIEVIHDITTGTDGIVTMKPQISVCEGKIMAINLNAADLRIYDISGTLCGRFKAIGDTYVYPGTLKKGFYVITSDTGFVQKVKVD